MDIDLYDLRDGVHNKILVLRNIENIIEQPTFERLWNASDAKERKKIFGMITDRDKDGISSWLKFHPDLQFAEKSLAILKEDAKKYKIRDYCRMSKLEVIRALEERTKKNGEK